MKKKRKLAAVAETPAAQVVVETSAKDGKKARKAAAAAAAATAAPVAGAVAAAPAAEKAVAEAAAAEPAPAQPQPAKPPKEKKARTAKEKKARREAAKLANKGSKTKPAPANSHFADSKETPDVAAANSSKEESLAVFVGGFPFETSEEKLREDFDECGEITKFLIPKDAAGSRKGIAFITFKTKAGVEAACKFDRSDYGGRVLMVNKVGPPKAGKSDKGKGKGETGKGGNTVSFDHEVSVRGLPWSTTSEQLKKHFEECGAVVNFKLLYNQEGKVRGSAFVAFKDEEGLRKALVLNETEYGGRTIYVCKSGDSKPITPSKGKDANVKGKGKGKDKGKGQKGKA